MARVRLNETRDLPEEHRRIFERMEERQGGVLNIFRALSHCPEPMRRFMRLGSWLLEEGRLSPALRELAILRAGWECRSRYEFSQHVSFARRAGLTEAQIRGVGDPTIQLFDPQQMAVLAFAGELSRDAAVSDATWSAAASFFDEAEMVELAMVTAYYNMVSRMLNALEVELDARAAADFEAVGAPF
ncbi:MAG TPA: carboxymuconolactone decarboxylase family protein [Dehalococcoidia bacterium]|nr:carboxymuconolactone decarboxylase family protein [Dehalococcoidia bacterium]